ncbi:MAG: SMC-Scp complex subunit ScpB [Thermoguttaceae bacterium]|nr:SMC-Scp complex subunit ScpB [Thermoguttaceae bacterium]
MSDERAEIARVEAVLFLMKEPCPSRKLAQLADVEDGSRARALVRSLNERYRRVGSAFCAVEVAGGFQLRTLPEFAPWLFRLQEAPIEARLTPSAMETLAIVAYEQPVVRATVERVRGVHCGDVLRQLLEQNLIKIVGRSEELGRPFLYGTTKRFLQMFGLMRIEDLPEREFGWATKKEADEIVEEILEEDKEKNV